MAESTASKSKIDDSGINVAAPGVVSTTDATPAKADETSVPNALDAKSNEPPVRTNRPDVAVAQVLTAGAGEHHGRDLNADGVDKDGIDAEGRFVGK